MMRDREKTIKMTEERFIYMDYAATTPARKEAVEAMLPYMSEKFGNPSSLYGLAETSGEALEKAREQVASALGAESRNIYFTSGGTEADNWAIKGAAFSGGDEKNHIITSQVEHHAVLHATEWLEKKGFDVTYLPVDRYGMVDPADVEAAITEKTVLVTIMTANNEIGTIMPIAEIGRVAHDAGVLFHTDAVQAVGHIPIDVSALNADMLSISGHKFGGPKGTGALYIGKGVAIDPLIHGGAQERHRRAGTENVPGIVGMAEALNLAVSGMDRESIRTAALRDRLIGQLLAIPKTHLTGHPKERLPNNVSVVFEYIEGESILLMLNRRGICASTGSACSSKSLDPSHVLMACGLPHEIVHGSLRLTLGPETTEDDVDYVAESVREVVQKLRNMSPLTPPELRR